MGTDKAQLTVRGRPQAEHVLWALTKAACHVTVLGKQAVEGFGFLADREEHQGPLSALREYQPKQVLVFVCSCDLPLFDQRLVEVFSFEIKGYDVCVPVVDGFRQPLCGLYTASAFKAMREFQGKSMLDFLKTLSVKEITDDQLQSRSISKLAVRSANTRSELKSLMMEYEQSQGDE